MGDGRGPNCAWNESIFEDWGARACIFDVESGGWDGRKVRKKRRGEEVWKMRRIMEKIDPSKIRQKINWKDWSKLRIGNVRSFE